jgi:hypothetical protein
MHRSLSASRIRDLLAQMVTCPPQRVTCILLWHQTYAERAATPWYCSTIKMRIVKGWTGHGQEKPLLCKRMVLHVVNLPCFKPNGVILQYRNTVTLKQSCNVTLSGGFNPCPTGQRPLLAYGPKNPDYGYSNRPMALKPWPTAIKPRTLPLAFRPRLNAIKCSCLTYHVTWWTQCWINLINSFQAVHL